MLLCCIALLPLGHARAGGLPDGPVRALYGLSRKHRTFAGKSPDAIAAWLKRHQFNAVFGGYRDTALVGALKRRGIKVYAEIALFVGKKHWRRHPESRPITAKGKPIKRQGWYAGVCPNQPWLRAAKLKQIQRLVRRYGVDGVWLDFIRFPGRWEGRRPKLSQTCFCPVCLRRFTRETGITLPSSLSGPAPKAQWILAHHRRRFVKWKVDRIAEFAREARRVARKADPELVVGLFGVPWRVDEKGGAIRAILGQDHKVLARHVDVISPMVYHRMVGRKVAWIGELTSHLHSLTGKPVLPVVQACSVPTRLSDDEFIAAVRAALRPPSSGVIVFSAKHFFKEKRARPWLEAAK
jgi:hypothetical protein